MVPAVPPLSRHRHLAAPADRAVSPRQLVEGWRRDGILRWCEDGTPHSTDCALAGEATGSADQHPYRGPCQRGDRRRNVEAGGGDTIPEDARRAGEVARGRAGHGHNDETARSTSRSDEDKDETKRQNLRATWSRPRIRRDAPF